jgi:hypothetical protein
MKKFNEIEFQNNDLKQTVEKILNEGMKVFVYDKENSLLSNGIISWAYYTENDNIGYVQCDTSYGVRFSTSHKVKQGYKGKGLGSGYGLQSPHEGLQNPSFKSIREAFIIAPNWAKRTDLQGIDKWENFEEYCRKGTTLKHVEVEL